MKQRSNEREEETCRRGGKEPWIMRESERRRDIEKERFRGAVECERKSERRRATEKERLRIRAPEQKRRVEEEDLFVN